MAINISRSPHTIVCFRTATTKNNRKHVEGYFSIVQGGRWFVFLAEPCAAGNDVRLCTSGKDWCQVSMCVWLAGPTSVQREGGVTELHHM